ncbi:MAG: hypothetical protein MI755_03595 [Sphingomonadales bacterium]|nr:hypothetical protein [Sphingomonadales bacterium]
MARPSSRHSIAVFLISALLTSVVLTSAQAQNTERTEEVAATLGQLLSDLMTKTYMCQRQLGGLGHYQLAMSWAERTMRQVGLSTLEAAELVNTHHERLEKERPDLEMAKAAEESEMDVSVELFQVCSEDVNELYRLINLHLARLGLR